MFWCHTDTSKFYLLILTFTVLSNYDLIFSNWWNRKMFLQLGLNQWPPPLYKGALTDWAMKDTALSQSKLHLYVSSIWLFIVQNTWQPRLEWSITLSNSSQAYDVMFYYVGFVLMSLRHDEILFIVFDVNCTFEILFDFCNWWNRKIVPSIGIEPMTSPTLAGRSNLLSYKGHSSFTIKVTFLCFINSDFV